jgi:flavin-binding protein dodecin
MAMPNSVYKIIELVGTSPDSWEAAAKNAVETASKSLKDLRIAEVLKQDMVIEEGKPLLFRTKLSLSFKYHTNE